MNRRVQAALLAVGLALCGRGAFIKAREWTTQEMDPFQTWVGGLDASLPRDARILIEAPESMRTDSEVMRLSASLHPRACYLLPPSDVKSWIREKRA